MRRHAVLVGILLAAGLGRGGAEDLDATLRQLFSLHSFTDVAISPDGSSAIWAERTRSLDRSSTLSLLTRESAAPRRLTAARDRSLHRETGAAFSRDSKSVAFLSDADGRMEVYLAPLPQGEPVALTHVTGQFQDLRFSPDGKSLAVLFVRDSSQETGALVAYRPDSGVVGETEEEQRIAVIDIKTRELREVGPKNLYVYDYDWAPDSQSFVAEATEGSGTNNYWIATLERIDLKTGATRTLWKPPLQIACPRFSPDGKTVAVIHGLMSDEGSTGGDLFLVPSEGGAPTNLTPSSLASFSWLRWTGRGELILGEVVDGETAVAKLAPAGGTPEILWKGPERLSHFDIAQDGTAIAVKESFASPPEVHMGPLQGLKLLTSVNAELKPLWGTARNLHWSSDGLRVQGWLLPPKVVEAGKRYPLVVIVHGGPSAAAQPGWPGRLTDILASQGYFVLLPNPRGSYGQGEAFTQANVKDFGYGDFRDILSGVDEVLSSFPIDRGRVGIAGWSYGGYMAMWAVTQTKRFSAAVAGAGIVDLQSYYGQNRTDRWMIPFFGASVYDDPWIYARSSPITFIKACQTPTLVLHGDRDSEVPTPQGYEFWHALKRLGVPTQLVIYAGEGHAIRTLEHQEDIEKRSLEWFNRYLGRPRS